MKNAFNEMEEATLRSFHGSPSERKIRKGINSSLGTVRFLGKVADVYVSRMLETMIGMASGPDGESKDTPKSLSKEREGEQSRDLSSSTGDSKYPNL